MQRYFINQNADIHQRFFITNSNDFHHITNVMRKVTGDKIIVTFKDQQAYVCEIVTINQDSIEIALREHLDINTELPQHITVCSGLIKSDKFEWMLQKATELGASQFIAVQMERSVVKLNFEKSQKSYHVGKKS